MGPKAKGKAKRRDLQDDDADFPPSLDADPIEPITITSAPSFGFSAISGFGEEEDFDANHDEEGNDLGGLMSFMAKVKKNEKSKKKKKRDDEEDVAAILAELDEQEATGTESQVVAKGKKSKGKKTEADDDENQPSKDSKKKGKKGRKANEDDEEDAVAILAKLDENAEDPDVESKSPKKKESNKKGKKSKQALDDDEDAAAILAKLDAEEATAEAALATEVPANGSNAKASGKKGKKGKRGNDDEEDAAAILAKLDAEEAEQTPALSSKKDEKQKAATAVTDGQNEGDVQTKSKKKLAKKQEPVEEAAPDNTTPIKGDDMNDQAGGSKNKKKKKPAAKEEPAPEPVAAVPEPTGSGKGKKKPNALVAALQAKLAAEKAAKEEEERRLAEEQRRIEEEEARVAAAEKAKQEAKLARKERERQKKEEQKKAGTYMTPAQIQADRLAKQRLQVMLAQGLKVEGLLRNDENASETPKPKRVVYAKKKKPTGPKVGAETSVASTPEPTPSLVSESKDDEDSIRVSSPTASTKTEEPAASAIKDSWDDSSEDEKPAPIKVTKDSWEEESEEENAAPIMKSSATTKDTLQNKNGASGGKTKVSANNGTAGDTVKPGQTKPVAAKTTANKVAPPNEAQKKIPTAPVKVQAEPDEDEDEDSEEDSEGDSDEESDEDSEDYSDEDSDEDGPKVSSAQRMALMKKQEAQQRKEERLKKALAERSKDNLRSPICAILGHVDTGKTKLLDKIRQTNVQEGEAGGITQQIGATYFPMEAIRQKTAVLKKDSSTYKLPGLLIIDTPGHESFTNLRSRGSSLCNIAILVVDIMHGLEPQTIESIGLLRQRKTPFIVALNKIDRIYGWKSVPDNAVRDSLAIQPEHVKAEFAERVKRTIVEFAEQGLNACLYYENTNFAKYVSLVPTSAITGEGIPDILDLVIDLTQNRLTDRLMYLSELECTVLEVKVIEGLGTTIDVILSNGVLREGDRIVICGLVGPIVTNIRALLTPEPMRELRIKSAYVHHKEVKAALGVKISAPDLEKAIAGSRLMVVGPDDDEDELAEEIMSDFHAIEEDYITRGRGVCVQASTLGSLEALLSFLKSSKIPVSGYNLGPIHKKDIIRTGIMLERHRELALLLAFDVPIDRDAQELADEMGIKVFKADIIYHLFDQFTAHMAALEEQRRRDQAPQAVFPCILRIIPGMVFNKRSPIVMGVDVVEGFLRIGTPICVVDEDKNVVDLGKCTGIELNRKPIQESKRGSPSVSIKLEMPGYEAPRMYGRHFTERNELYSHISRASIDILKSTFKNDLTKEDWATVIKLKKVLKIE